MNRILPFAIVSLLFVSCAGEAGKLVMQPSHTPEAQETPFIITDYKNKIGGGSIPEWAELWLEKGNREVETLDAYKDRFVFIARNEGNTFEALSRWADSFSQELDFPRLAAERIGERFLHGVAFPDNEYGAFFETLIRAASDAVWTGARKEDVFWLHRKYILSEESSPRRERQGSETWEFLILVSIEKTLFSSQLDTLFQNLKPSPLPTKEQINTANRVKTRFYEDF